MWTQKELAANLQQSAFCLYFPQGFRVSSFTLRSVNYLEFIFVLVLGSEKWNISCCISKQGCHQYSSVTQSCPTLCGPINCSTPGLLSITSSRSLLKLMSIKLVMPSSYLILCCPLLLLPPIPPNIRFFQMSHLFAWGGQSTGVSASASVPPMNTQDWSPLGWTGWISLQSKGLSRVFSNTTVQKHRFFSTQLSSQSNSHIHTWPLEKP